MNSSEIRQRFLDFFSRHQHTIVASSSLIPGNDPTLLFTNAGMVQFKDVFLGRDIRPYQRAASAQRCVRAGGKHNDLENVGYTARHHTFFEMLGNFSFGDYFKTDAIHFAWEFLTVEMQLPAEKLWVTVYHNDDEAYALWTDHIGIPAHRVIRIGDKPGGGSDNFWQMGDTGPCGPCTEIFYDHGEEVAGGPPGSPDEDGDRYIEIWNIVFMQFNRDETGTLHPLPKPSVDTGMGLERISAVLQGVHSNYDIDLFQTLIRAAARVTDCNELEHNSLKVIADHIRACAFLITDGVIPGNEGRGYVLRRIIRRAIRHGYQLGQTQPFFHLLVEDLAHVMGHAYPELVAARERVAQTLRQEEARFAQTLEHGMAILEQAIPKDGILDGETAFKLYDTYGFPLDLTADIGRERGFRVDTNGFDAAMAAQRERARHASKFSLDKLPTFEGDDTRFEGYATLETPATILAIYVNGTPVDMLTDSDHAVIVLDQTPFYAESGGQAGDQGILQGQHGLFDVDDTQKIRSQVFGHSGRLQRGILRTGDTVTASVNVTHRLRAAANHSATHLLHAALRNILGNHVHQKGSLVDAQRLRFDFSHPSPLDAEQRCAIERQVNTEIRRNLSVSSETSSYDDAVRRGAMALFGEKYGDEVRVIAMGDFSIELCGGTHTQRTGDIGLFVITSESGVAGGIRRIEALTGEAAVEYLQQQRQLLDQVSAQLKTPASELLTRTNQLLQQTAEQDKTIFSLKTTLATSQMDALITQAKTIGNLRVVSARMAHVDARLLRESLDHLKSRLGACVIVLAAINDEQKISLVAGSSDKTIHAGQLAGFVAEQLGGKGGGRADMAQGGGNNVDQIAHALDSVTEWVTQHIKKT
jgi:alanyl-tRNA synthetase